MVVAGRESVHVPLAASRVRPRSHRRATGLIAIALVASFAMLPAASARARKAITSAAFAGGIRPDAVFDAKGFFDAARRCGEKFPFSAYHADAERKRQACLADFMKDHHATPQAIAFMKLAPVPAAISEIRHYGPVAVVHAKMMWADASDGWALIGDSGEVVPLWTPPAIEREPRFERFLGRHPGVSLWSDSIGWPKGRPRDSGGESLRFRFGMATCHACARIGEAIVRYDFDAHGRFTGVHLVRIVETPTPTPAGSD